MVKTQSIQTVRKRSHKIRSKEAEFWYFFGFTLSEVTCHVQYCEERTCQGSDAIINGNQRFLKKGSGGRLGGEGLK